MQSQPIRLRAITSGLMVLLMMGCTTTTIYTGNTYSSPESRSGNESRQVRDETRTDPSMAGKESCPCNKPSQALPVVQVNGEIPGTNPSLQSASLQEEKDVPENTAPALVAPASEGESMAEPPAPTSEEESFFQGIGGGDENDTPREMMEEDVKSSFQSTALLTLPAEAPPRSSGQSAAEEEGESGRKYDKGDFAAVGTASWYGRDFDGKKTASGEIFDSRKLTAAHRDIPLGSVVLVRNLENGKEVMVTVNDRGPYVKGRIIDLSEYGAELLGYKHQGLTTVGIKVVRAGNGKKVGPGVTRDFYQSREKPDLASSTGDNDFSYISAALDSSASGEEQGRSNLPSLPPEEKERILSSMKPEETLNAYSVQVGVFEDVEHAARMRKYLEPYGEPVHILQRGSLFVVKVGRFKSRYAAEQLKYQLVSDGYTGFISGPSGQ